MKSIYKPIERKENLLNNKYRRYSRYLILTFLIGGFLFSGNLTAQETGSPSTQDGGSPTNESTDPKNSSDTNTTNNNSGNQTGNQEIQENSDSKKGSKETAKENKEEEEEFESNPYFTFAKEESMEKYVNEFPHRLKFRMGIGLGSINPGILNETGSSWMINSYLASQNLPGYPFAFPISKSTNLDTIPQFQEISYGWKNRVDLSFSSDRTLGKYDQGSSAAILLFTPRTENYWASAFEGNRLLRFEGRSEHLRLSYTHPIFDFFMIGPSINMHRYTEKNELSNGSYTTRRSDNVAIWSIGGTVSANYAMKGILPGILMKLQLMPWWEIRSRVELIDRKGNFGIFGGQVTRASTEAGGDSYHVIIPVYSGQVRDKGNLIMLETSLRYCRFSLDIGVLRQDVKRTYSAYYGDSFGPLSPTDYNAKTRGLGVGEMVGSFRHRTQEFYIMPSIAFHFDEDGIY